ncbi:hypothetical protein AKJ62_03400 [candidate division MSBL1 archaeon SCGC-AAA259D14]|uniref:acetate--CoA ligase (ADP-forming) n=1 Tax=candidate division MSBL1 archaeon SCGC-AAA259D14 TaxID=1698261 RepID=A0A133U534_9EURY|nr:hypothetical protein AKJ62_03400 [candidate division MSBL1 archaeon SCGC-AAA259D14]
MTSDKLDLIFNPNSVAVVGASEARRKVGYLVMKSLIKGDFKGKIYPVNPKRSSVLGMEAYPSIKKIPAKIDLAVIAIPPKHIPKVMNECVEKKVPGGVIITAGFKETKSEKGIDLQNKVKKIAEKGKMMVIGPNTFGMVNIDSNLNASFTSEFSLLEKGKISLVSQSGGVCHLAMPYALRESIGLNKIMSLGNRLTVDFHDMIDYLAEDPNTESIALYIEGLENPKKLMDAAKEVSEEKPIVAYKAGKAEISNQASLSHTGSLAGKYTFYKAAFRQAGIITAKNVQGLVCKADALAKQPPAKGKKVGIITLVAGLGLISSDVCESQGLKITKFSRKTNKKIRNLMPPLTIRSNPVDLGIIADDVDKCGKVIKTVFEDENVDCVTINYLYSWSEEFLKVPIQKIFEAYKETGKPLTVCLEYPEDIWDKYKSELKENNIPTFSTPELAAKALAGLVKRGEILEKHNQLNNMR